MFGERKYRRNKKHHNTNPLNRLQIHLDHIRLWYERFMHNGCMFCKITAIYNVIDRMVCHHTYCCLLLQQPLIHIASMKMMENRNWISFYFHRLTYFFFNIENFIVDWLFCLKSFMTSFTILNNFLSFFPIAFDYIE